MGALAVALGAFGTHALSLAPDAEATWRTASLYHLLHSALIVVVGLTLDSKAARVSAICLLAGLLFFSGSLYVLALSGQKWLGAIAPIGGLSFILGWIALTMAAIRGNLAEG